MPNWSANDFATLRKLYRDRVGEPFDAVRVEGSKRSLGGKRTDLGGQFFRSRWEANFARYLRFLVEHRMIRSWGYETKTFEFTAIKRGTRFYTPDFEVVELDGARSWREVKGWMDAKSKTRLKRMAKYFPQERIVIIDQHWFAQMARSGLTGVIPGWETGVS